MALINASKVKVVDESMCAYRPRTTATGGLPNISFIKQKLEPLGKLIVAYFPVLLSSLLINAFLSSLHKIRHRVQGLSLSSDRLHACIGVTVRQGWDVYRSVSGFNWSYSCMHRSASGEKYT